MNGDHTGIAVFKVLKEIVPCSDRLLLAIGSVFPV